MLVSIWGDMERLFGGGEEAEIWRPSVIEKLEEFLQWKRDHPGESFAA